jgi:predicted deacylase
MKTLAHPLLSPTPGVSFEVTTLNYGAIGKGRKIYIQAALHADETPAILTAHVLRGKLDALEAAGKLKSEIVLAPMVNPVGVGQFVLGQFIGRFELGSGNNYNRGYPFLFDKIAAAVEGKLGADGAANVKLIRAAWREALEATAPLTVYDSLQRTVMLLAHDADITLDLHCSREASMHIYTGEGDCWATFEALARYLQSPANLIEGDAGGQPFDEAQNVTWHALQQKFGKSHPIPHGNVAVTVEHRGQKDVTAEYAEADAQAIVNFLTHTGDIDGTAPPMPELVAPATPLGGSEQFKAPISGVLVYRAKIGDKIEPGQALFDIVEPVSGKTVTLKSSNAGIFYMGRDTRWVRVGEPIGRVSGSKLIRSGKLLSA